MGGSLKIWIIKDYYEGWDVCSLWIWVKIITRILRYMKGLKLGFGD